MESPSSHNHPDKEQEDLTAQFLERMRKQTETQASHLRDLYKNEGYSDSFNEALEDLTFDIAFEDETYAHNASTLKNPKLNPDEAKEIVEWQRGFADTIKKTIILEAGLPTEEFLSDIELAQEAVRQKLEDVDLENVETDELLRKIGILNENEEGGATFTYPEELFPESVNEKWNLYMLSVKGHVAAGNEVHGGYGSRADLEKADEARRFAHNRISEDLHKVLGFDKLPESDWNFESTRRLVAKMRDSKFIGEETGESRLTSRALARGMGQLSVISKLSERFK